MDRQCRVIDDIVPVLMSDGTEYATEEQVKIFWENNVGRLMDVYRCLVAHIVQGKKIKSYKDKIRVRKQKLRNRLTSLHQ